MFDTNKEFHPFVIETCKVIDTHGVFITGGESFELKDVLMFGVPDKDFETYCKVYSNINTDICERSVAYILPTKNFSNSFFLEKICCLTYGGGSLLERRTYYKFLNLTEMQAWWFSQSILIKSIMKGL